MEILNEDDVNVNFLMEITSKLFEETYSIKGTESIDNVIPIIYETNTIVSNDQSFKSAEESLSVKEIDEIIDEGLAFYWEVSVNNIIFFFFKYLKYS